MLSYELYDKVMQYIVGEISVSELEEWLVPRYPFLLRDPESDDSDLIGAIELGLAEMGSGIRTEEELKEELKDEIHGKTILVGGVPGQGSSVQTTSSVVNTFIIHTYCD